MPTLSKFLYFQNIPRNIFLFVKTISKYFQNVLNIYTERWCSGAAVKCHIEEEEVITPQIPFDVLA